MDEGRGGIRLRRLEDRLIRYLSWLIRSLQREVENALDRAWTGPGHVETLAEAKGAVWQRLRAEQVAFHRFLQRICRNLRPLGHDEAECFDLVRSFVASRRQFLLDWVQLPGPFTRGA